MSFGYLSPHLQELKEDAIDVIFNKVAEPGMLGCLDPTMNQQERYRMMGCAQAYADVMPVYSRLEVIEHIKRMDAEGGWRFRRVKFKKNQLNEGTCVYNMGAHMLQNALGVQFGDENQTSVSPVSGYRWNAPNARQGSTVGGCARWLESTGLLPTNTPENIAKFKHTHPDVGYSSPFQVNWKETAREFRAHEWMYCRTVEEWWSAIINGHGCGGGRDGHAVGHLGLGLDGNRILSIYIQSWFMPWGFTLDTAAGPLTTFGADSEAKVKIMVARDGWALRTVRRPFYI